MKSLTLFKTFCLNSLSDCQKNFALFFPSYIVLLVVCLASLIPWEIFGFEKGSGWELLTALIGGVISLIFVANIILKEKERLLQTPQEKLLYGAPTYLVYTLYSSLAFVVGFLLLIIPSFFALIFFSLAPVTALLSREKNIGFLKQSYLLVKKNIPLVIVFVLASVALELMSVGFDFIANWRLRITLGLFYSFFEAYAIVVLTLISVRLFYYLEELP